MKNIEFVHRILGLGNNSTAQAIEIKPTYQLYDDSVDYRDDQ